jgi:benzoate membrane transport protein
VCYILVGVFGVTLAAVFMAFPATFITTLAGLALLGTIGAAWPAPWRMPRPRGRADHLPGRRRQHHAAGYWRRLLGLVIGLVAYAVLNGRCRGAQAGATAAIEKERGVDV